jgi:hypothetical protein
LATLPPFAETKLLSSQQSCRRENPVSCFGRKPDRSKQRSPKFSQNKPGVAAAGKTATISPTHLNAKKTIFRPLPFAFTGDSIQCPRAFHDPADGVANFPISATRINDNVASRIDVNERPTACSGDDSHRLPELSGDVQ